MSVLATACLFAFAIPGTLVCATLAILASWLPARIDAVGLIARVWAQCLLAAGGVRVAAEVAPALDRRRGCVYISNHQSYFDIPILFACAPVLLRFAAKRSLFWIPVFGWSLKAGGFIPVDRADRSRAREVWSAAARRVAAGVSVVFFPEGTRSRDGRMLPFQRGGFLVALKSGAPIVPVGISGARRVMPPGRFTVTPGVVTVRYGAPIDPGEYGLAGKAALVERVRGEVARLAGVGAGSITTP
jgi:1-acyl-sn-glycerol-3-phosphate acyltransferase